MKKGEKKQYTKEEEYWKKKRDADPKEWDKAVAQQHRARKTSGFRLQRKNTKGVWVNCPGKFSTREEAMKEVCNYLLSSSFRVLKK
jgi:hypothetical protein